MPTIELLAEIKILKKENEELRKALHDMCNYIAISTGECKEGCIYRPVCWPATPEGMKTGPAEKKKIKSKPDVDKVKQRLSTEFFVYRVNI